MVFRARFSITYPRNPVDQGELRAKSGIVAKQMRSGASKVEFCCEESCYVPITPGKCFLHKSKGEPVSPSIWRVAHDVVVIGWELEFSVTQEVKDE